MFVGFTVDDDAAVEYTGIFVEFPAIVVIADTCVLRAWEFTFEKTDPATSQVMMKRMCQADSFVLYGFPTGMEPADVVGHIARKETMFAALDLMFQAFAIVGKRRFLVGLKFSNAEAD